MNTYDWALRKLDRDYPGADPEIIREIEKQKVLKDANRESAYLIVGVLLITLVVFAAMYVPLVLVALHK